MREDSVLRMWRGVSERRERGGRTHEEEDRSVCTIRSVSEEERWGEGTKVSERREREGKAEKAGREDEPGE